MRKGSGPFGNLRGKDDGLEPDAVAHGNHYLPEIELDAGFFGLSGEEQRGSKDDGGGDSHRSPSIPMQNTLADRRRWRKALGYVGCGWPVLQPLSEAHTAGS